MSKRETQKPDLVDFKKWTMLWRELRACSDSGPEMQQPREAVDSRAFRAQDEAFYFSFLFFESLNMSCLHVIKI